MEQKALPLLEANNIAAESAESGTPHHPGVLERLRIFHKSAHRELAAAGYESGQRETVEGLPVRSADKKRSGGTGGAEEAPFVFS